MGDRPDGHGQFIKIDLVAAVDDLLAGAGRHGNRRQRIRLRAAPAPEDLVEVKLCLQGDGVNLAGGPENAGHDGNRKSLDVLEQKGGSALVGDLAEDELGDSGELPILVYLFRDAEQFFFLFQNLQVMS